MNSPSFNIHELDIKKLTPQQIQYCIDAILSSWELAFSTARSGGKWGQNVNKVETKVQLAFNVWGSRYLSQEMKLKLYDIKKNLINEEWYLKIASQESRSQLDNKQRAISKFSEAILDALLPQEERVATKPTKASQIKRLDSKQKDSRKKKDRNRKYNE